MKLLVCVKIANGSLNPFDEWALEWALEQENAEITLLSMAPANALPVLKNLTRLGGCRAVLLSDTAFSGADTLATSYVLSLAARQLLPDLIVCGRQSMDGDTRQVPHSLAQMTGMPVEICTMRKNLRFPSIRSKVGEVEIWNADTLHADKNRCGLAGSPTRVLQTFENTVGRRRCHWIGLDALPQLIDTLRRQERVLPEEKENGSKLKNVWCVGEEIAATAKNIAESVTIISRQNPETIAQWAVAEKPGVILWPADDWGRQIAPRVAAILQTGLCADCTQLETDGRTLYMYRPALGGNVIAKIVCRTLPQMATVHGNAKPGTDVMVACGRGVAGCVAEIRQFAKDIGAQFCASRALVDMGLANYDEQIGLTGKTVSPNVYMAIGISGAVQHTCAIEGAGHIIAVNCDKDARIFDYADYGIICEIGDKHINEIIFRTTESNSFI